MKIKVAVFDDNSSRRASLCILIDQQSDMECVGAYENCVNAVHDIEESNPDVVLMDIDMPQVNGIEGVRLLRTRFSTLHIIMETVFEDDDKIINAISAGANGYILKKAHPIKLIEAIHEVLDGGAPMTPSVAKRVLELFQQTKTLKIENTYRLTEKEVDVLKLLVEGFSYKMIAASHNLSVFTINAHVRNIYKKLQVHSVAEAVSKVIQQRLV